MTKRLYRADVMVCATAYVRADSAEQARELIEAHNGSYVSADPSDPADIPVSILPFGSTELPEFSLSPAMTFMPHSSEFIVSEAGG